MNTNANLASILDESATGVPDRPAVVLGDRSLDYATLDDLARRFAGALGALGAARHIAGDVTERPLAGRALAKRRSAPISASTRCPSRVPDQATMPGLVTPDVRAPFPPWPLLFLASASSFSL